MTWEEVIALEKQKDYYKNLKNEIDKKYEETIVFPEKENIFKAFTLTKLDNLKVVILGQDPYHNVNQAHGLSFSVMEGVKTPPSLVNIYKEIKEDLGLEIPKSGNLTKWAKEGVLLLNTVLTVRAHQAYSHRGKGWEIFTDKAIESLNQKKDPVVFLLWGRPAQEKEKLIKNPIHKVLKAPHPSPLSAHRGFFGCRHFSKTNEFLKQNNLKEIDWKLE